MVPVLVYRSNTMFERFTERARQVVVLAQDLTRQLNHDHVDADHMLLALVREEEGLAARVLSHLDFDFDRALMSVRATHTPGDHGAGVHIPFTSHAKRALEVALREALTLGHNYIGTEHVLLGLTRMGSTEDHVSPVFALLDEQQIAVESIRDQVYHMLRGPSEETTPSTKVRRIDERPAPLRRTTVKSVAPERSYRSLTASDIEHIGRAALASAETLGVSPEYKRAFANLASAASELLVLHANERTARSA